MIFNSAGFAILKKFEGCKLAAYPDPGPTGLPWTIAFGHTRGVREGMTCSQEQADAWLLEDANEFSQEVKSHLGDQVLNDNQFSALVCFAFNVKSWRTSTVLDLVRTGKFDQLKDHWPLYCKAEGIEEEGLKTRRMEELELFQAA